MVKNKCSGVVCLCLNSCLTFISCVALGKSFKLSDFEFSICKVRIIIDPLAGCLES